MSKSDTKMVTYKPPPGGYQPTPEEIARLEKLKSLPDGEIDFSDIPEITDEQWANRKSRQDRPIVRGQASPLLQQ